jgi:hypothetical protein
MILPGQDPSEVAGADKARVFLVQHLADHLARLTEPEVSRSRISTEGKSGKNKTRKISVLSRSIALPS